MAKARERSSSESFKPSSSRTDVPTAVDQLHVGAYVNALSTFVSGCDTPMTVAIQGDWGSGKTSLMNMVAAALPPESEVVQFNTWQYSQFDMGDDLVLALLEQFIAAVGDASDSVHVAQARSYLKDCLVALGRRVTAAGVQEMTRTVPGGGLIAQAASEISGVLDEAAKSGPRTVVHRGKTAVVTRLRGLIEEYVALGLAEKRKHLPKAGSEDDKARFVVLVDDLDRLAPPRAVELMEALKIFLDVPGCVFVLAIDFDVVKQGVRGKFGDEFDERKAIAFFDKIIQLPFSMPVDAYRIDEFLQQSLNLTNPGDIDPYVELVHRSIGNNPRSLKRIANVFHLLKSVSSATDESDPQLFAAICLQSAFPLYYRDFTGRLLPMLTMATEPGAKEIEDYFAAQITGFRNVQIEGNELREPLAPNGFKERLRNWGLTPDQTTGVADFLETFRDQFVNPDGGWQLVALRHVLIRSALTSVGGSPREDGPGQVEYGLPVTLTRLRERGIPDAGLGLVERLASRLDQVLPGGAFDVGVSSKNAQAQLYVDASDHSRGTLAELSCTRQGRVSLHFGREFHPADSLERWRSRLFEAFGTRGGVARQRGFQIHLRNVREFTPEQLEVLTQLLEEAHGLTRERFFPGATSGS